MKSYKEIADEIIDNAVISGAVFNQFDQQQTDFIVQKVFEAGFQNRIKLARMAAEETEMGIWQHKVIKNVVGTHLVYESIKNEKTAGVISMDHATGMIEIAQPIGPVFGIIPITNPTATVLFKILIALKSRNPIIISPPRKAPKCCEEAVRICYDAAIAAGAPEDCIQILTETNRELTHAFMIHPKIALILATGGTGLVHAAYSSGNPALGVGPGNVPVFIDQSADIPFAVECILGSKTFDNGTICASEQAIVCENAISKTLVAEFEKKGCYFLSAEQTEKLEKVVFNYEKGIMSGDVVGKTVQHIAALAGISVPDETRLLIARQQNVGKAYPLSQEILAPIIAFYETRDYKSAIKLCIDLNYLGGIGHTACVYSNDEERILEFSQLMNAGRIMVNTPSVQGAVGGIYNNLPTSLTLGCGSGGKNITTENVTARHLINIQRVCRRRNNEKWLAFDQENFLDESLSTSQIIKAYNKNF
ncbi:MAG: aldehyde dehydrogenase family protein [Bacteroidales bacterium]|nr:aldehyde dehydrogenase family protein [Bacteroidales bacterium]